jgi:hypothetical protein
MPRLTRKGTVWVWPELIGQAVLLSIWLALFRQHNFMVISLVFAGWNVIEAFRTDEFRWWHFSVDEIPDPWGRAAMCAIGLGWALAGFVRSS